MRKNKKKILVVMVAMSLCMGSLTERVYAVESNKDEQITDKSSLAEIEIDDEETKTNFDKCKDLDVLFLTEICFTDEQAKEYKEAIEKDLKENIEHLENDLLISNNKAKSKAIKKEIEMVSNVDTSEVFNGDKKNTIVIPMKGIDIDCDVICDSTDENGEVEVKTSDVGELIEWCDEQNVECYQDDEGFIVKNKITVEEFAEGGLKMSEDMMEAEGQKVVTVPKVKLDKKNPKVWGKNYSKSRLVYSTDKYPNIVHCNKCDDSSNENEKNVAKWLLDGSDCATAIRLGTLSLTTKNLVEKAYYAQNVVCVVESCQNLSGKEGANIYCNSEKKSGPHWNCSWFNGINHTESFHFHQ